MLINFKAPPTRRKGRGLASNNVLEERRKKVGKPLDLELDPVTNKVVGQEDQAFIRMLGTLVSMLCPGHYLDFADVPQQFKDQVLDRMRVKKLQILYFSLFNSIIYKLSNICFPNAVLL